MSVTTILAVALIALELGRIAYHAGRVERRLKQIANALELIALRAQAAPRDELAARRDADREGLR